uniref:Uncharacterized protein n=1 Tax=Glossina pallidipes TaxID=7398 RepID=A0A1A9ZN60_GLOPL
MKRFTLLQIASERNDNNKCTTIISDEKSVEYTYTNLILLITSSASKTLFTSKGRKPNKSMNMTRDDFTSIRNRVILHSIYEHINPSRWWTWEPFFCEKQSRSQETVYFETKPNNFKKALDPNIVVILAELGNIPATNCHNYQPNL